LSRLLLLIFAVAAAGLSARADQLVVNGGFESGLSGWIVTNPGSMGDWFPANTSATPLTGNPTAGPASGNGYAVTDQFGPGTNALSQKFIVPLGSPSVDLSFEMFVNDWAGSFDPATNYLTFGIKDGAVDPVSGAYLFTGTVKPPFLVSGGLPNPYLSYNLNISSSVTPGHSYIIDFVESDSIGPMNVGVDNVSIVATPEPASIALLLGILVGVGGCARRRSIHVPAARYGNRGK
jgi:hypothetical protein